MRRVALIVGIAALSLFGVAQADVVSGGDVRVSFRGWIKPRTLPRSEAAPISLHVSGLVTPIGDRRPATLERVTVEVNRFGILTTRGLPTCPWRRLRSTRTARAFEICRDSLVGTDIFKSHIDITEQLPFPAVGRMLALLLTLHVRP